MVEATLRFDDAGGSTHLPASAFPPAYISRQQLFSNSSLHVLHIGRIATFPLSLSTSSVSSPRCPRGSEDLKKATCPRRSRLSRLPPVLHCRCCGFRISFA